MWMCEQRGSLKVSSSLLTYVQALTAPTLSLDLLEVSSPSTAAAATLALPNSIRAHGFIALGKLCLRDQALSKRSLPLFIRALSSPSSPLVLRNNLLIVLSDLCRTFTALVDPHLGAVTSCLLDPAPLLRRHALLVLSQLLQEDYLKLKPSLLLPMLATLGDDEEGIAGLARSALSHLLGQQGSKAQHAFMDAVFYLNGCAASSVLVDVVPPSLSQPKRLAVYDFVLGHLQDEAKLMTASKLCQDVLGAVVDGGLSVEQPGVSAVVHDTLTLLSSDAMRLHSKPASAQADDDADDADAPSDAAAVDERLKAAKGRLLSQLAKKSALESIVPIVMDLKRKMEAAKSPLVAPVMGYLRAMWLHFRGELMEILNTDRQLAVEFEFDMRRMEEERRGEERRSTNARHSAKERSATKKTATVSEEEATTQSEPLSLQSVAAAVTSSPAAAPAAAPTASPASGSKTAAPFETPSKGAGVNGSTRAARATATSAVFVSPRLRIADATPQSGPLQNTRRVICAERVSAVAFPHAIFD